MKIIVKFLLATIVVLQFGCKKESPSQPDNGPAIQNKAVIEGTVFYFVGGGTVELMYPPGFTLLASRWIVAPSDSIGMVYLIGMVDSSYIDKRVRASGTVVKYTILKSCPEFFCADIGFAC